MESVTQVQILYEAVCVLMYIHTPRKSMKPSIMGKS